MQELIKQEQQQYIGSSHLRIGVEFSEKSLRVFSMWVVKQPLVQSAILNRNIVAQVNVIRHQTLIQTFADPRISRGIYQEKMGHSQVVYHTGLLYISVPYTKIEDLRSLEITIADITALQLKERSIDAISALFAKPKKKSMVVQQLNFNDICQHPDWTKITKYLGIHTQSVATFQVYLDKAKKFRWRLLKNNGEIVADSGEGYDTREQCETDLRWIQAEVGSAKVEFLMQ
jgi:uncharacterized protein